LFTGTLTVAVDDPDANAIVPGRASSDGKSVLSAQPLAIG
jgi:hypothetical protein